MHCLLLYWKQGKTWCKNLEWPAANRYYSLSPGFWQSFISIEVCRDCIPALASSCKKQLTGFFACLLFFLKIKRIS